MSVFLKVSCKPLPLLSNSLSVEMLKIYDSSSEDASLQPTSSIENMTNRQLRMKGLSSESWSYLKHTKTQD